jgi:hypothetical protein
MTEAQIGEFLVMFTSNFKAGDPSPEGYLAWHAWADVQYKAGLRQAQCPTCGKWRFPQELSTREIESNYFDRRGRRYVTRAFLCLKCSTARSDAITRAPDASDG